MPEFTVRRILREDIVVEAENEEEALNLAENEPMDKWDCYDADYWSVERLVVDSNGNPIALED
jgi:hypothetical protein